MQISYNHIRTTILGTVRFFQQREKVQYPSPSHSQEEPPPDSRSAPRVESFFAKMAKTFFRGLRVKSKEELKARMQQWLDEINETPIVFRWKYGLDVSVA
jgi:hypothetical protein